MSIIGARVAGELEVLREVARGAVARVYLVSDGRVVKALKVFPASERARADQEFVVGSGLEHPRLNPVEALVEVDGRPGVLMPFVRGRRLGEWLAGCGSLGAFFECVAGVLDGLAYLHERGVVHRDVKPENILVGAGGDACLLDFDLAVRAGERAVGRGFAGTIAYLSPEQARGEGATAASDLYAVGVILYRAATGQVPFTGSPSEVLAAHRTVVPERPSVVRPELLPFDGLLERLLAKDAGDRPRSAADAAREVRALRQSADGLPPGVASFGSDEPSS